MIITLSLYLHTTLSHLSIAVIATRHPPELPSPLPDFFLGSTNATATPNCCRTPSTRHLFPGRVASKPCGVDHFQDLGVSSTRVLRSFLGSRLDFSQRNRLFGHPRNQLWNPLHWDLRVCWPRRNSEPATRDIQVSFRGINHSAYSYHLSSITCLPRVPHS